MAAEEEGDAGAPARPRGRPDGLAALPGEERWSEENEPVLHQAATERGQAAPAERDHDDLVLAVAMAAWLGQRDGEPFVPPLISPPTRRTLQQRFDGRHESASRQQGLFGRR
jgi:hypothetical protein